MSSGEFDPDDPLAVLRGSASTADDRFVDQLEARLRVQHAAAHHPDRQPLWRRVAVLAPTMVVLFVIASFVFVARDQSPSAALVLTDSENVTVHLLDGTSIDDPADGFELTEGVTLEIHDGGMATIDDITVDVAAILVVRDGELVTDAVVTTTTDAAEEPDEPDRADEDVMDDRSDPDEEAVDRRDEEIDVDSPPEVDDRVDTEPVRQDEPGPKPTVRPRPEEEPDRDDSPVEPPAPIDAPAVEIGLRLRAVDGGVRISWFVRGADDSWTVAVIRREGRGEGDDASTVSELLAIADVTLVADARQPSEGHVVDDVPVGDGPVRYRVLVVDTGGGIVASSPSQSLRR